MAHKRISGLDLMKALGAYLVILYHLTFRQADQIFTGGWKSALLFLPTTFLSVCVPLFFTASGALSLTKPTSLRKNTLRAVHLAFLTLFWTGVSLLIVLALKGEWWGWREFFRIGHELRIGYIQHLWYLPTFLFLTLLIPVLHSLKGNTRVWRYGLLLLGLFTFGNSLLNDGEYVMRWLLRKPGLTGTRYFFWYVDYFAYHYWYSPIYLALGAFLMENRTPLRLRKRYAAAAIPLCMIALTVCAVARCYVRGEVFDPVFNNYGDPFTLLMTASVGLLLMEARPGPKLRRAAASLADCSLGIYLIHWLLIEVLLNYAPAVTEAVYLAPLTAVAVLAVSWAITWGLRKIPAVRELLTASPKWIGLLVD